MGLHQTGRTLSIKTQMNASIKMLKLIERRIINAERNMYFDDLTGARYNSYETAIDYIENAIANVRDARRHITEAERLRYKKAGDKKC